MAEPNKSVELDELQLTESCEQCGEVGCEHLLEDDVEESVRLRKSRKQTTAHEMPVELAEFEADHEIEGLIGEGGMSSVYKALNKTIGKHVAIKMLHSHLVRDEVQRKRFLQEANALFVLEHPHIVRLRNAGASSTGKPYLIMDFLQGQSLSERLKETGPMPVNDALRIFVQMCSALEHAHSKGIVHRDIKPSNIVLEKDAEGKDWVRVVDFGIAKFNQDEINPGLTQTGDVFGSPLYMSPEQCLGQKLDQRSDIYALGCVMYEVLSGKPPLVGESALSTIHKHTAEMPKPLVVPNCNPNLRGRLDEILFKTLEKDPEKRYQSMKALQADLAELSEATAYKKGAGFYVKYTRFTHGIFQTIRRHPIKFVSAIAVIAAASTFGTSWFLNHRSSLMDEPKALNNQISYVWTTLPVQNRPAYFRDQVRKAHFIVDQTENRVGVYSQKALDDRRRLAGFFMSYGVWEQAIRDLGRARERVIHVYGPKDINLADIDVSMGDCYLQKKNYEEARNCYERAIAEYKFVSTTADNTPVIATLKYAVSLQHEGKPKLAEIEYRRVIDKYEKGERSRRFERTMAESGLGDVELSYAQASKDPSERIGHLNAALSHYSLALPMWKETSAHDWELMKLRLADISILQHDYASAIKYYADAIQHRSRYTDRELEQIETNYARLLWRTFHWQDAFAMDDQAREDAKRASAKDNEQNDLRFDADADRE